VKSQQSADQENQGIGDGSPLLGVGVGNHEFVTAIRTIERPNYIYPLEIQRGPAIWTWGQFGAYGRLVGRC
jgi:hypothetical protein